jgi:hypothetical protein
MGNPIAELRRCLVELDVGGICALWRRLAPTLPQPRDNAEALASLHIARTQAVSIPERLRLYSHAWLVERNLPTGLPDELKPKAERLYPRRVEAVGIAVKPLSDTAESQERARAVEHAMAEAVNECYADGERNAATIKARMMAARRRAETR